MSLTAGTRLSHYEILAPIGAGGMGEVYKARDSRLNRTVAMKVLPAHIAQNAEAKQRFEREAKAIAGLKHPHICVLFDIGQQDGIDFLVMEYLEGKTLAEQLKKGPIPVTEAVKIAMDTADALDRAHSLGVVHRDLKPGNIMLTVDGVKLLDFGLSKINPAPGTDASDFPTAASVTAKGTILGTLQYMAPEQIEGQEADARTDIFAFGAVLYEMVTGRKAFEGKSQPSLMSAILLSVPPAPSSILAEVPPLLDHVIERCLAKNPAERWHTARDLMLELKWVGSSSNANDPSLGTTTALKPKSRSWVVGPALGIVAVAALVASVWYLRSLRPSTPSVADARFEIPVTGMTGPFNISLSPDGRRIVYSATSGTGPPMLWVRPINSLQAQMLPGTENATFADWSPDGHSVVFSDRNQLLKRVDVDGGSLQTLATFPVTEYRRSTWNRTGDILFANRVIRRVSAQGGDVTNLTELDKSLEETAHATPCFLPDGNHFLYQVLSAKPENRAIYIGSLDSKMKTRLMSSESKAVFSPPGFILFLRDQTLMARPFDAKRLEFTGDAVPVVEDVAKSGGLSAFYASTEGTLIYRTSTASTPTRELVWMDRAGNTSGPVGTPINAATLRLSLDDKKVAFSDSQTATPDIFIMDINRNPPVKTRLTTDPANDSNPVFSPDGSSLVFQSRRSGDMPDGAAIYEIPSSAATPEKLRFNEAGIEVSPRDWSIDGRYIILAKTISAVNSDLWVLPLFGDQKAFPYLTTAFNEDQASISPNARWLAYVSNEAGKYEVLVRPFPDSSAGKVQISTEGGRAPRWKRDGRELYYLDSSGQLIAVAVTTDSKFEIGKSSKLFKIELDDGATPRGSAFPYDASADGQRFMVSVPLEGAKTAQITVLLNWTSLLKR